MKQDALNILLSQRRFDLIFKYLYAKRPTAYHRAAYLEHIRAFNGFYELNPSDGKPKNSADDFINSFDALIESLKNDGYDASKDAIPMGSNGEIQDGAHRLAACAALGIPANIEPDKSGVLDYVYDYRSFRHKGMDESVMDYGALEYVKLNPNAHVIVFHSITEPETEEYIETIFCEFGVLFYKKIVRLTRKGLKEVQQIEHQDHTWNIFSSSYAVVYVFVCDDQSFTKANSALHAKSVLNRRSIFISKEHIAAIKLGSILFDTRSNCLSKINGLYARFITYIRRFRMQHKIHFEKK